MRTLLASKWVRPPQGDAEDTPQRALALTSLAFGCGWGEGRVVLGHRNQSFISLTCRITVWCLVNTFWISDRCQHMDTMVDSTVGGAPRACGRGNAPQRSQCWSSRLGPLVAAQRGAQTLGEIPVNSDLSGCAQQLPD